MKKIIQFKPKNISWSSILIQILDINIQAINKTLEEGNIDKNWGDIMLHYGVSEKLSKAKQLSAYGLYRNSFRK